MKGEDVKPLRPVGQLPASPAARPPKGLGPAGRQYWRSITSAFDLEPHEVELLGQAGRVVDRIAELDADVDARGALVEHPAHGGRVLNPAVSAARAERIALARLVAVLRLPDRDDQRPQRRSTRGVYGLGGAHGA